MRRELKIIYCLIKQKLIRQMMYKESFIGGFFVNLSLFVVQLMFFAVIYDNTFLIGEWSKYQFIFFIGTYNLIINFAMMFFYFGIIKIPQLIRNGKMDYYILKPCNSLLYISFENFDLSSFPMVIFSIIITIYAAISENTRLDLLNVSLYIALLFLMCLLYYDLLVLVRCISFYTVDISGLESVEWSLTELNMKIPGTMYKGFLKYLFCIILPYGLVATIPSYVFFNGISTKVALFIACIVSLFSFLANTVWKYSLRHYRSASS
jgi:ABC-2 type transport system permease protein